jgi:hypothetical protein
MQKILFVTPADFSDTYVPNGGTYVSRLHLDTLSSLPDVRLTVLSLSRYTTGLKDGINYIPCTKNKFDTMIKNICGYASYLTPKAERIIMKHIKNGAFDILFLDTSNFGCVAKKAKKAKPDLLIITFFHNVEFIYAKSMVQIKGICYLPTLFASWHNEKLAVKYSNILTAINNRDKNIIEKIYNTHVSYLLPPYYVDYTVPENSQNITISKPLKVLFVGAWFFANIKGITWFIDKVLPKADIRLTVAGRGMEELRKKYAESVKLQILGTVENLEALFLQADCFVNPVFDGSGMKIKTGEALRYGKTVVGTTEAFAGYDITSGKEGYICETVEDFIDAFNMISLNQKTKTNIAAYNYFKTYLCKEMAVKMMGKIIREF